MSRIEVEDQSLVNMDTASVCQAGYKDVETILAAPRGAAAGARAPDHFRAGGSAVPETWEFEGGTEQCALLNVGVDAAQASDAVGCFKNGLRKATESAEARGLPEDGGNRDRDRGSPERAHQLKPSNMSADILVSADDTRHGRASSVVPTVAGETGRASAARSVAATQRETTP